MIFCMLLATDQQFCAILDPSDVNSYQKTLITLKEIVKNATKIKAIDFQTTPLHDYSVLLSSTAQQQSVYCHNQLLLDQSDTKRQI